MTNNLNLFYSRNITVDDAYIITVKGNESSERYSLRCQQSCANVGMPYVVWDAFDGTKGPITTPEHSKNCSLIPMLKVTDHYMTRGEVACALSHISLWVHCAKIDKPIIIMEHDSIMIQKFTQMNSLNSIVFLGSNEWVEQKWPVYPIPPHASEGPNYLFICRAHAYAIDPLMAKNLIAHVLKMGIHAPLDIMLRADLFNITHQGVFAFDKNVNNSTDTTILARPATGRTTERNDKLER
jgi:hypothetical protein